MLNLQIHAEPTNAQSHCYVLHSYVAPTSCDLTAIIKELTAYSNETADSATNVKCIDLNLQRQNVIKH
jgi:hypothetical protein